MGAVVLALCLGGEDLIGVNLGSEESQIQGFRTSICIHGNNIKMTASSAPLQSLSMVKYFVNRNTLNKIATFSFESFHGFLVFLLFQNRVAYNVTRKSGSLHAIIRY